MTTFSLRIADLCAAPFDAARSSVLRALGRPGRQFLVDRERRVALYGSLCVATALLLTTRAPFLLLALGPVLFGIPHLVSDVRYLVVRRGLHHRSGFWPLLAVPLALPLVVPHAASAFPSVFGATILARGSHLRRSLVLAASIGLTLLAVAAGPTADVWLAHAHNIVALALWWFWAPPRRGARWLPLAIFTAVSVLLLCGTFDRVAQAGPTEQHAGLTLQELLSTLSPTGAGVWGFRCVLFFAFAQSVHYAIWLRLIPEEDRPRAGLRSFASSLRALRTDLGLPFMACCGLAAIGLVVWAAVDLQVARLTYLRVALFHGPMELAVAALAFVERDPLRAR